MRKRFFFVSACVGCLALSDGRASLEWEATSRRLTAGSWEEPVTVIFPFANAGRAPVTVLAIKSGCDCTVVDLAKKTYGPGERGELKAIFDPRGRSGVQDKAIQVFTDDASQPVLLNLQVTIKEALSVTPRLLWWKIGSAPDPKEVLTSPGPDVPTPKIAVHSENPALEVHLMPVENGEHRLVIQPTSTAVALRAVVYLTASTAANHPPHVYTIHVQVR